MVLASGVRLEPVKATSAGMIVLPMLAGLIQIAVGLAVAWQTWFAYLTFAVRQDDGTRRSKEPGRKSRRGHVYGQQVSAEAASGWGVRLSDKVGAARRYAISGGPARKPLQKITNEAVREDFAGDFMGAGAALAAHRQTHHGAGAEKLGFGLPRRADSRLSAA